MLNGAFREREGVSGAAERDVGVGCDAARALTAAGLCPARASPETMPENTHPIAERRLRGVLDSLYLYSRSIEAMRHIWA